MSILDRLKSQPPWKDPDPAVRVDGTYEIPDDEQDLLVSIAREDPDAKVREAVIGRLESPDALRSIANSDTDVDVRAIACDRLIRIACAATGGDGGERATSALSGLSDDRHLAHVAKSAGLEQIAAAALTRLSGGKSIAAVAKQSEHPSVRLAAVGRLEAADDLTSVAQNSEYRDSAVAALERIDDPEALRSIAALAKCKVAGRRAKAMLRAIDAQTPALSAEEQSQADVDRRTELCQRLDACAQLDVDTHVAAELESIERAWDELASGDPAAVDDPLGSRFDAARALARRRLETLRTARAHRELEAAARNEALAGLRALCDAAEALGESDGVDRVTELRAAWASLDRPEGAEDEVRRFETACATFENALLGRKVAEERAARLRDLVVEAEALVNGPDLAAAASGWATTLSAWESTVAGGDVDPEWRGRFDTLREIMSARQAAASEARERKRRERQAKLERTAGRIETLIASDHLTLKSAERALRDIRSTLDILTGVRASATKEGDDPRGLLPTRQDRDALLNRFRDAQVALFPRLEELRQADDWQRWANASVQEQLCARTEALLTLDDLEQATRELRSIQDEWKKVRAAPRDRSEALWQRFKTATDAVRERCQPYLAARAEARTTNLARKEVLCEQVEALADSSDWIRTAETIKKLQADWKSIGPGFNEKVVWERFRAACDRFFGRRKEDLARRKKVWAENLAAKIALCERAEALSASTDWDTAALEFKTLQAEWKTVGPVQRSRAEVLWKRFRTACDGFFERFSNRNRGDREANLAAREAICAELERLLASSQDASPTPTTPERLLASVRELRTRWSQTGGESGDQSDVSVRFERALRQLGDTFATAFKGTDLDLTANARQLEQLCERVERLIKKEVSAGSATSLAAQLKEALAANTIGGGVPDESRWRTMTDEVRDAQAAAKRLGALPPGGRALADRFRKACDAFFDQRRKAQPPPSSPQRPRGAQPARRGHR